MNKIISLIKVSFNHDMNIFKINTKKQSNFSKIILPLLITIYIMFVFGIYAQKMITLLMPLHLEFIVLTLFALSISLITLIEGIYKSSSLLFNCKDDQLLFSLPIKKRTILLIRILKFYTFEFLYNSLFLLPSIIVYAYYIHPNWTYYLTSFIALLLLPIIPIVLSCLIGFLTTFLSSKFKGKNIFQTIFAMAFILIIFYLSYNLDGFMNDLVKKATSLNDLITKLYYPVGSYISLVNNFNIKSLFIYIIIHLIILSITIYLLGKIYFNINSNFKIVLTKHNNKHYVIKKHSKMFSFIKKELNKFISTPVFITNAGFSLVLFIIACIFASIKFDSLLTIISQNIPDINSNNIKSNLPILMFGLVCFTSLMTSITSSMISLESKSFNILKSLPLQSFKIVLYKVLASLTIIIPCIIIGDIIIFIRFKFDLISIILILIATFIIPFTSELIGIIINLKYPKLDATNDTEIVKQSMSSMISVFIGIVLIGITFISLFKMLDIGIRNHIIILVFDIIYGIISIFLWILLIKISEKSFNNINS